MTAKSIFEAMLVELSKVNAPSLLLEDFNYLFNKAINLYVNKQYNIYDVNLQTTDNLRVLKSTAKLTPSKSRYRGNIDTTDDLYNATYEVKLPNDYLHMLNCICVFKVKQRYKCYNPNTHFTIGATRLTADAWSKIVTDYYNRPTYRRPYYYINNINTADSEPYAPYNMANGLETDQVEQNHNLNDSDRDLNNDCIVYCNGKEICTLGDLNISVENDTVTFNVTKAVADRLNEQLSLKLDFTQPFVLVTLSNGAHSFYQDVNSTRWTGTLSFYGGEIEFAEGGAESITKDDDVFCLLNDYSEFPRQIILGNGQVQDIVDKTAYTRHANASTVVCEIRCGRDNSVFELETVYIDYIKAPQFIRLTQEQLDQDLDTSQVMEYPDYVCNEIINELVTLVMENTSDQRLQNHLAVTLSIASPTQQLAQPQQ